MRGRKQTKGRKLPVDRRMKPRGVVGFPPTDGGSLTRRTSLAEMKFMLLLSRAWREVAGFDGRRRVVTMAARRRGDLLSRCGQQTDLLSREERQFVHKICLPKRCSVYRAERLRSDRCFERH